LERRIVDLAQHDAIARLCRNLRDAMTHEPGSEHAHLLDLLRHWTSAPVLRFAHRSLYAPSPPPEPGSSPRHVPRRRAPARDCAVVGSPQAARPSPPARGRPFTTVRSNDEHRLQPGPWGRTARRAEQAGEA